jgi:predicted nucleic acid-binding protein
VGALTLPTSGTVYVDSNALIYSVEKVAEYWPLMEPVWIAAANHVFKIASSELVILETLVAPLKNADAAVLADFEAVFRTGGVQLLPITQSILRDAAGLRARHNLNTPDSIHIATALSIGCSLCITNDRDFQCA